MMDKLSVAGVELWVRVGCTAEERAFAQRLELDFSLAIDLAEAGKKDDIAKTVDYAEAVEILRKSLPKKTYRLAEAVAERAAELLLKRYGVSAVEVRVRKRALAGIDYAEVVITRP